MESNVIPALSVAKPDRSSRPLGVILVEAGRLSQQDAERVLRLQTEGNLTFGAAALQLGLVTPADIEFALSQQFQYSYLVAGQSKVHPDLVTAYQPFSQQAESLRAVRAQLLLRWFDADPSHRSLAIVSAERKEGRSFIAANLAVLFAQLGERTLLVDADLRNPIQHRNFGLDGRAGLSTILSSRGGSELIRPVPSLSNLWVLPAGAQPPNPSELLARPHFSAFLQQAVAQFSVVLLDTPAAAASSDALTVCVRAGAALIVVRKNSTRAWRVRGIADSAVQSSATIVGAVMNDH